MPKSVAITTLLAWSLQTIMAPTVRVEIPVLIKFQVSPPSSLLSIPIPGESPASLSPVPAYTTLGFRGSKAIELIPSVGKSSVFEDQVAPPFVDFHNPPAGVPTSIICSLVG